MNEGGRKRWGEEGEEKEREGVNTALEMVVCE